MMFKRNFKRYWKQQLAHLFVGCVIGLTLNMSRWPCWYALANAAEYEANKDRNMAAGKDAVGDTIRHRPVLPCCRVLRQGRWPWQGLLAWRFLVTG